MISVSTLSLFQNAHKQLLSLIIPNDIHLCKYTGKYSVCNTKLWELTLRKNLGADKRF